MTKEEAIVELQNCIELIQQDGQDYLDETEQMEHDMLYEPTYNPEDGSM